MEHAKISPLSSETGESESSLDTVLILKRAFSESIHDRVQFDYSTAKNEKASQNWSVSQILPTFNKDNKFYTPAFIRKVDIVIYQSRDKLYKSLHQHKIQSNLKQETSDLVNFEDYSQRVPKPFSFNSYCTICKTQFRDYLKHIESIGHTHRMLSSQFCRDIDELCQFFGNRQAHLEKESLRIPKNKKIRKMGKKPNMIQNVETKCEFESIY